jgi:hypothetical protein
MKSGGFVVLNSDNLQELFQGRDTVQPVRAISYAPSGRVMGLGTWGGRVLLYDTRKGYSLRWDVDVSALIRTTPSPTRVSRETAHSQGELDFDALVRLQENKNDAAKEGT